MKFENRNFVGEDVVVDGNEFAGCLFVNCKFIHSGGPFIMGRAEFQGTIRVELKDAAHHAILFLQILSRLPGGEALLADLLAQAALAPAAEKLKPQ